MYDWAKAIIWESGTGDLINKSYAALLLDQHCMGEADHSRKIWTVLTFMIWHQVFIENVYHFDDAAQLAAT
jgi:asparagine synthase (glutamine-hydrolysing)